MKFYKTIPTIIIGSFLLLFCAIASADILISDFDDGTRQGWLEANPFNPGSGFNGLLTVQSSGGNPGGYLRAQDTVDGGGSLAVLAPLPFSGDLSELGFIRWDVLLPANPTFSTSALVEGLDGTLYRSHNSTSPFTPSGTWFTKTASFTSSLGWTRLSGNASFQAVINNAVAVYLELDVTFGQGIEAGIDNVRIKNPNTTITTCPEDDDIHIVSEGGGGLCTTAQASLPTSYLSANSINWSWLLGGFAGDANPQGGSPTTVPIYHPSGDWTNFYLVVRADVVLANGNVCSQVWNNLLLDCGTAPGDNERPRGGNQ